MQCGVQCLLCLPLPLRLLRPWQRRSQGICQVIVSFREPQSATHEHIMSELIILLVLFFTKKKLPFNDVLVWVHLYRFFKESSDEEREHAEKLMKYQVITSLPVVAMIFSNILGYSCCVFPCALEHTWREGEAPVHCHTLNRVRPPWERRCFVRWDACCLFGDARFWLGWDLNIKGLICGCWLPAQ